ncbi:MAG: DNA polymerase I [Rikenellaceae bacterium]|nr:DNA polymerase I [Rikenellaceae bacterium]
MKRLFLIDAYALIFRYYYAFMTRPMRNREGLNTSPVFGFVKFLRDILRREQPDCLGVAFDPKGGCFRREIFPEYKANRSATPEDIHAAVPYIKRLCEAMRIPVLEVAGYEADDVIGTLAHKAADDGFEVFMVTPDKDYGQLVTDRVKIYKQKGEGVEIIDREAIKEHYGFDDPILVRDVLALWGDASDNIPGVQGIGEKGAIKLVNQFGTVEQILEHTAELTPKQRANVEAGAELLLLSKRLASIVLDVPIEFDAEALRVEQPDVDALRKLYIDLDFNMFARELPPDPNAPAEAPAPTQAKQTQLIQATLEKSRAKRAASLAGQGDMFAALEAATAEPTADAPTPEVEMEVEATTSEAQPSLFEGEGIYATAATTPHTYHIVRTAEELSELVDRLSKFEEICFDTETSGLDFFNDRLVGMSFAVEPHEAWYVAWQPEFAEIVRPLMENDQIAKIGQNIKFDAMMLRAAGVEVRGKKYDTMILHYLLDPESRHNMNVLAQRYLNYSPIEIETLIGRGAKQLTMDMLAVDRVAEYAAEDADVTLQLKQALWPKVCDEGLQYLYAEIEEPMIDVLADMEWTGVRIDTQSLAEYKIELQKELTDLEWKIRELADEPTLNVNSSRQLGEVLFAKLRIDPKPRMTKTKQFRTDEEYIQSLASRHPIVGLILEYRGVKKLLSTYVEALPLLVNSRTGHIHTSYNQAVTATGRLSSANPNLQNIPIRDERGRRIRAAFIPSDSDHVLLSADYSQVELRLMAHLSGDESLIEAFRAGQDVHSATAARLFHTDLQSVTSEQRRRAKTANFGIIYGISAFGLAQRLDISRTESKEIIDGYFASYPKVKEYMDRAAEQARNEGFVSTIFGRRRYLNDINSRNAVARGVAERNAINAPIQGSAADIMKLAMVEMHRKMRAAGLRSRMILQVHDEIVIDLYRPEQEAVAKIVVAAMERAAQLSVPLTVDYGVGENWLEAH